MPTYTVTRSDGSSYTTNAKPVNLQAGSTVTQSYSSGGTSAQSSPSYTTDSYQSQYYSAAAQAAAAEAARKAQNERQVNAAISGMESQRSEVKTQADDAKREAYQSYMQSSRYAPEQMAAAGLSGGVSETMSADLYRNYENSRAGIDKSLLETNRKIDSDINKIRQTGEANAAGIAADYAQNLQNLIMQYGLGENQALLENLQFLANNFQSYDQLAEQWAAQQAATQNAQRAYTSTGSQSSGTSTLESAYTTAKKSGNPGQWFTEAYGELQKYLSSRELHELQVRLGLIQSI